MPSKKSKKKHPPKSLGDVTLNDFANSTVCKNRPKKSINNVATVVKNEQEKTWDEKEDDFEGEFTEEVDEDGTISYVIKKTEARRRKKTSSSSEKDTANGGNTYPIDIWFLLSEYIRPEDVGRFAAICKTSNAVVCTAKFWFTLYRKYYVYVPNLPSDLQREYLVRKYNLRASVIRSLHIMYPPFVIGRKLAMCDQHPDVLKKMQCTLIWFSKLSQHCLFYFRMQAKLVDHYEEKQDFLEVLDDIHANHDENCRVLRVACVSYTAIPAVLGLTLTSVNMTLSQGLTHHKLHLGFGSGIQNFARSPVEGAGCVNVVLEPVINVKVLDWWHPLYPRTQNMEHLLNQE